MDEASSYLYQVSGQFNARKAQKCNLSNLYKYLKHDPNYLLRYSWLTCTHLLRPQEYIMKTLTTQWSINTYPAAEQKKSFAQSVQGSIPTTQNWFLCISGWIRPFPIFNVFPFGSEENPKNRTKKFGTGIAFLWMDWELFSTRTTKRGQRPKLTLEAKWPLC